MGDIFVAPVRTLQTPRWRLKVPGQVSRGAAPPTGIFPVVVAAAAEPVAIPIGAEASGDLGVILDAALYPPDPHLAKLKQSRRVFLSQPF